MMSRPLGIPFWACTLLLLGCGLSDYERRIDQHAARLKVFDEENKYLGPPITNPTGWSSVVCVRLLKEIEPTAADKPTTLKNVKIYQFPGKRKEGPHAFVAVPFVPEPEKDKDKDKDKAKGTDKKKDKGAGKDKETKVDELSPEEFHKEFRKQVRQGMNEITNKDGRRLDFFDFKGSKVESYKLVLESLDGKPAVNLEFDKQVVTEPGDETRTFQYAMYVHHKLDRHIAVVFQLPRTKADLSDTVRAIELCLKSLEIGPDAAAKKKAYERHRPK